MNTELEPISAEELEETCYYIAGHLSEETASAKAQIRKIVTLLGTDQALAFMKQAREVEKSGGMLTSKGDRRRSPGGVFFFLVQTQADKTLVNSIWPQKDWKAVKAKKEQAKQSSQEIRRTYETIMAQVEEKIAIEQQAS